MAQFYGGKSVPMVGVAGIAVEPESRGRGFASRLMRGLLEELRRDGVAISSLYPATTRLYRTLGYEQAGQHFEHAYPVSRIAARRATRSVRAFEPSLFDAVKQCYTRWAQWQTGALDRRDYIWNRVQNPRSGPCTGFVVEDADAEHGIGGYVFLRQERDGASGRYDLQLTDLVAATPEAARSLLSFIGEFGSMAERALVTAGAMHPLFTLLDEPRYLSLKFKDYWMLRIVDIEHALLGRGYGAHASATLELDITDDVLPSNSGRYVLAVDRGEPRVSRGGAGTLKASIQGLAQLYSGQFHPETLAAIGRLEGPREALASAAALFASSATAGYCDFF
jgi:predicted acetyltransferase